MRGLFELSDAKGWGIVLNLVGVVFFLVVIIMHFSGVGRVSPSPSDGFMERVQMGVLVLGIVCVLMGVTVSKVCNNIAKVLKEYDEELERRLSRAKETK